MKNPLKKQQETNNTSYLVSRDEMNLAEFPLTVLSTRADPNLKTLEFSDMISTPSGKPIKRSWIITGADKFGLPTASDDEVLLGLLKLSVESSFTTQKIHFTRYELLRILRWTTEGRSYSRLQKALDRLSGVRIKAANAFFDNETKSHSTKNFGIIDAYELNDGRDLHSKKSFFIWSEELFNSFKAGFIKKLDLDFYLDLKSAVSKRLFRYLDKNFWYRSRIKINIFTLAHEKVGISRNYKYASSLKQQLEPGLIELKEQGFLGDFEYQGSGKNTEVIILAASTKPRSQEKLEPHITTVKVEQPQRDGEKLEVIMLLVERGLQETQASKMIKDSSLDHLLKIKEIIKYYDNLLLAKSPLISKSPIGFLYRAVERPDKFILPENKAPVSPKKLSSSPSKHNLEDEYQKDREQEIADLLAVIDQKLLKKIETEVRTSLENVRKLISKNRFEDTVQHGIGEKVASLFAVPSFEDWLNLKKN